MGERFDLDPEGFMGYRVVRAAQALEARFKHALAPFELSARQFSVLAVLVERPSCTAAELARAVLTTPQSMATLIEGLERRGLVARDGPRRRGVATPLVPTDAARAVLERAAPAIVAIEQDVFGPVGAEHREGVRRVFADLEDRLDP